MYKGCGGTLRAWSLDITDHKSKWLPSPGLVPGIRPSAPTKNNNHNRTLERGGPKVPAYMGPVRVVILIKNDALETSPYNGLLS